MIRGLWAEEATRLLSEQWVNVYEVSGLSEAIFYCSLQVQDLGQFLGEFGAADWFIEPTDEDGNVMSMQEALQR
jgi:hypothetical protein